MQDSSNDIFVDLISTASLDEYPDNKGSHFTNKLPIPLSFSENWQVALEEISYTNCFYNVVGKRSKISIYDLEHRWEPGTKYNKDKYVKYGSFVSVQLEDGYYTSEEALIRMINKVISNSGVKALKDTEIFTYDKITLKVHFDMTKIQSSVLIKGPLLNLMGFEVGKQRPMGQYICLGMKKDTPTFEWRKEDGTTETRHFYHPNHTWFSNGVKSSFKYPLTLAPYTSMVVYTDIIASQMCGNVFSDAIRFLPIKDPSLDVPTQIIHECRNPYFLSLNKRYIPTIELIIKDLQNNYIDFLQGEVRVKFRFRRKI